MSAAVVAVGLMVFYAAAVLALMWWANGNPWPWRKDRQDP